jgi:hypothetical protein
MADGPPAVLAAEVAAMSDEELIDRLGVTVRRIEALERDIVVLGGGRGHRPVPRWMIVAAVDEAVRKLGASRSRTPPASPAR